MRVIARIDARMASARLPGKTLREVAGRPVLAYVLERALACKSLDQVIVATTNAEEDSVVGDTVKMFGVPTFAGSQ